MKSEHDQIMYAKLTGQQPTPADLARAANLDVFAFHISEIVKMKRDEVLHLGYGAGTVHIYREAPPWKEANPIHDQFYFQLGNNPEKIWVGNFYGALDAYSILWQLPPAQAVPDQAIGMIRSLLAIVEDYAAGFDTPGWDFLAEDDGSGRFRDEILAARELVK